MGLLIFICLVNLSLVSSMLMKNGVAYPEIVYERREANLKPRCTSIGKPLDLLFIMDSSGSMRTRIQEEVNVTKDIVKIVAVAEDATRVSLIQYSGVARTEFHFNTYKSRQGVLDALDAVRPIAGITKTGNAISHAFKELNENAGYRGGNVPTIAFILSDGRTQDYPDDGVQAQKMRSFGVDVWAYGTGEYVAIEELVNLTADANKIVTRDNYGHLTELFTPFKAVEICEEAAVCVPGSDKPLDLLFVVDSSDSIIDGFREQINFMQRVLNHVNVHPEAVRVALITYAARPTLDFDFGKFQNAEDLGRFLLKLSSKNTTTRTDLALRAAYDVFKDGRRYGARNESVPKMTIVITDGRSERDPTADAVSLTTRLNVTVFAVGVLPSDRLDVKELTNIAGGRPQYVFTRDNLMRFESEFTRYVSVGCAGGYANLSEPIIRQPLDVQCDENAIVFTARTLSPFMGKLYAVGFENDPKCVAIGGKNESQISITLAADTCGFRRTPVDTPTFGFAHNGTLMLQFHPAIMTKIDEALPVGCFAASKTALPNRDAVNRPSLKETTCTYSLRQYDTDGGCLVLDARVGEHLWHKWQCDTPPNYAVLVHDCYAVSDDGHSMRIIDDRGCQVDPFALETPAYDRSYVYRHFNAFKFPGATWLSFKCNMSFCDKDAGQCDGVVPPVCGDQNEKPAFRIRSKRSDGPLQLSHTMQVETRRVNVLNSENVKFLEKAKYCAKYNV